MKSIDDLEGLWKRFCQNPSKTAFYLIVVVLISIASVMMLSYLNGYFAEMGRQSKGSVTVNASIALNASSTPGQASTPVQVPGVVASAPAGDLSDLEKLRALANAIQSGDKKTTQLTRIVESAIKKGELAYAVQVAEDIPYDPMKSTALAKVVDAYANHGNLDAAQAVAQKIPTPIVRNKALAKILSLKQ